MKPEYDAGENLKEQMDAVVALYEEECSLRSIADGILQKVALKLRHSRKLVPFCGKNVQFKIYKVFFDSSHLCDLLKGGESRMRVLKVLQKLVVFQGTVCAGAVGWQRSLHLKPVSVKFIETDWLQHIII